MPIRAKAASVPAAASTCAALLSGHGNVPIKQCMYQLKRAGYDDCISIEFEGMEPVFDALRIGLANLKKYWAEV